MKTAQDMVELELPLTTSQGTKFYTLSDGTNICHASSAKNDHEHAEEIYQIVLELCAGHDDKTVDFIVDITSAAIPTLRAQITYSNILKIISLRKVAFIGASEMSIAIANILIALTVTSDIVFLKTPRDAREWIRT